MCTDESFTLRPRTCINKVNRFNFDLRLILFAQFNLFMSETGYSVRKNREQLILSIGNCLDHEKRALQICKNAARPNASLQK